MGLDMNMTHRTILNERVDRLHESHLEAPFVEPSEANTSIASYAFRLVVNLLQRACF